MGQAILIGLAGWGVLSVLAAAFFGRALAVTRGSERVDASLADLGHELTARDAEDRGLARVIYDGPLQLLLAAQQDGVELCAGDRAARRRARQTVHRAAREMRSILAAATELLTERALRDGAADPSLQLGRVRLRDAMAPLAMTTLPALLDAQRALRAGAGTNADGVWLALAGAVEQLRVASCALHDPIHDHAGLEAALKHLLDERHCPGAVEVDAAALSADQEDLILAVAHDLLDAPAPPAEMSIVVDGATARFSAPDPVRPGTPTRARLLANGASSHMTPAADLEIELAVAA